MKTIPVVAILILAVSSCGPKNEEVTDEQIEIGGRTEMLDSIANTREDAVDLKVLNDTIDTLSNQ